MQFLGHKIGLCLNLLEKLPVFQNGCNILHSHQPCLILNNSYRIQSKRWILVFYGAKNTKFFTYSMSSFWPSKNLPSSQPRATVLPRAFLGTVRLRPLTLHRAWCTHGFVCTICHLGCSPFTSQSYVNPTIVIFSFFKTLMCCTKEDNSGKGVDRGGQQNRLAQAPCSLYIQPRFPHAAWQEKAKESRALLRRLRKSSTRAGLFFLIFKKTNIPQITTDYAR